MISVLAAKNRKTVPICCPRKDVVYLDMGNNSGLSLGLWITATSSCDKDFTTNSVCVLGQQLDPISTWQRSPLMGRKFLTYIFLADQRVTKFFYQSIKQTCMHLKISNFSLVLIWILKTLMDRLHLKNLLIWILKGMWDGL